MLEIIILILLYLISIYGAYMFIQKAHFDPNGRYRNLHTEFGDIVMMLIPVINIIFSAMLIFGAWKKDGERPTPDDFFKPKN